MNITNREQEILEEIKNNPQISQKDLSRKLGITRSAVAVHIMNLNSKGLIKGRGYIIGKEPFFSVIGGANIDLHGVSSKKIRTHDSNPGTLHTSPGGVARNIAENITRLGLPSRLITAIGNDQHGDLLLQNCQEIGIDTRCIYRHETLQTSTYLSIIDSTGEMLCAISDMDIISAITPSYIQSIEKKINRSEMIILDTNLSLDTLNYIFEKFSHLPIFVDTVSTSKAVKIEPYLSHIHTLKPNLIEAEAISGIKIKKISTLSSMATWFHERGLKRLFITLGEKGIFYSDSLDSGIESMPVIRNTVSNVSGAGDASMAGLVYAWKAQYNIKNSVKKALIASRIALSKNTTINSSMSAEYLEKKYNEQYL